MSWSDEREAELRASGWSDAEIRDYKRGYESVPVGSRVSMPSSATAPQVQALIPDQLRLLPRGDRGIWYRSTVAGQLAAVVSPPAGNEEAEEARRAREWADDYEYRYGRRPTAAEARNAVARRSDGVWLSCGAEDLKAVFRQAGLKFGILDVAEPLPAGGTGTIVQPVTRG